MIGGRILGQLNIFKHSAGSSCRPFKGADTVVVSPLFLFLPFCVGGGGAGGCFANIPLWKRNAICFYLCMRHCLLSCVSSSVIILSLIGL